MLPFVSVSVPCDKYQHPGILPLRDMGKNRTNLRRQFVVHVGFLALDINLVPALLEVSPHAVAAFREGGYHNSVLDGPRVIDQGKRLGQVDLEGGW